MGKMACFMLVVGRRVAMARKGKHEKIDPSNTANWRFCEVFRAPFAPSPANPSLAGYPGSYIP